jgi:hypothetical protein
MIDSFEIVELYQHHLEAWEDAYWEKREKVKREQIGRSNDEGLTVRAAFIAGWFGDKYTVDVDDRMRALKPHEVLTLATMVSEAREVARSIDPFLRWRFMSMSLAKQRHLVSYARLGALKAGEILTVTVGDNGGLEILSESTIASTSSTLATDTNEQPEIR